MYFFERQSYRKRRGMREIFHDCNWARPDPESWDWVLEESSTAFPATLLGSWVDAEQLGLTLVVILIAGKVNSGFTFWATALAPEIIKFCSLYTGKDEFQKDWKVFRLSSKVEIGRLDLLASWNLSFRLKMIVAPVAQLVSAGTYKTQDDKCTPLCWASQQTAISNWPHCSFLSDSSHGHCPVCERELRIYHGGCADQLGQVWELSCVLQCCSQSVEVTWDMSR